MHVLCLLKIALFPLVRLHAQGNIQEPYNFPNIVAVCSYTNMSAPSLMSSQYTVRMEAKAVGAFVD